MNILYNETVKYVSQLSLVTYVEQRNWAKYPKIS